MSDPHSINTTDSILNWALLHAMQQSRTGLVRHQVGQIIAKTISDVLGPAGAAPDDPEVEAASGVLTNEGYCRVGEVFSAADIAAIVGHFEARPCFNSNVVASSDKIGRRIRAGAEDFHYGSYTLADVLAAPRLLEFANHPKILGIAHRYLGCLPTLYSLHAWWTFPGHGKAKHSQEFHRDRDDFKFCTMFIYLTDVGPQGSPHAYIRRSHRVELVDEILRQSTQRLRAAGLEISLLDLYRGNEEGYGRDELYTTLFDGLIDTITGPAGTAFIADTSGLHKGFPAMQERRLMFWARYGLYRNSAVRADGTEAVTASTIAGRLPRDWRSSYVNRTLIKP
jgi:hypothetical protein